jgi:DNA polymerase
MKSPEGCKRCALCETRTNVLRGEGNLHARVMLIAQAPGKLEDIEKRMFIGPSGKMLDRLMSSGNIRRDEIYMTNLIKCILPHNRRPKEREIKACSVYLDGEIKEVAPIWMIPLGYYATKYLFARYGLPPFTKAGFSSLTGKEFSVEGKKIFPLSHPAFLLYHAELIAGAEENFKKIGNIVRNGPAPSFS